MNGPRSDTVTVWTTLLASSASVARQSLTAFATWSTALVVCLATPVLSVVFLTAMSSSAGGEAGAAVAYRCAVMVAVTTASALMVDLGMTDRRLGVIDSLLSSGGLASSALWLGRGAVTSAAGMVVGTTTSVVVAAATHELPDVAWHLGFLTVAALAGSVTGLLILAAGLSLRDPHVLATAYALLMPLLSTALLPAAAYPAVLKPLVHLVPGARLIDATRDSAASGRAGALIIEAVLLCALLVVARLAVRASEMRARKNGSAVMTS